MGLKGPIFIGAYYRLNNKLAELRRGWKVYDLKPSLAFAAIIVGTALAWWQGHFDPLVALLALILPPGYYRSSNLANDYGDAVKGGATT